MTDTTRNAPVRRAGAGAPAAGTGAAPYVEPYLAATIAGVAVMALYAITLAPTTVFWDASEYIAVTHIMGIPHPPGNPLFVVLARAWELLLAPTGLSVAVRVNLFSAFVSAAAHGFWFLVAHRILAFYSDDRRFRLLGAAAAVALSAAAFTVWNHSNVNEKVYTISLLTIALLSWLAFHWRDNLGRGKDDNLLVLMIFVLALSVGNHLMAFLAAPAIFLFILLVEPRTLVNWRLYAAGAVVVLLGLSVHMYLPIRAGLDPIINEADPSCPTVASALVTIVTYGAAGCETLSDALTRQQYAKPSMFSNPIDPRLPRDMGLFAAQLANYFQYFDWQWSRALAGREPFFGFPRPLFTLLFLGLGIFGAWTHWKRDRISWLYVATLFATLSVALTFYLNFRYGYSYPVDGGFELREVRERDYFFIVSFSLWGVWAGIGVAALWQRIALRYRPAGDWPAYLRTTPVLGLALLPLLLNWSWATRAGDYTARDWAYNLLNSVEPYGVLFTNGDNDTFPLWYLQEVEGLRQDVTVIVMSYLNTTWYVRQIQGLTRPCPPGVSAADDPTRIICQRPYRAEAGPPMYAALAEQPPTRSLITLDDAQIEEISRTNFVSREPMAIRAGGIETVVPPGKFWIPADLFLVSIITSALGDRPVYFASTTQIYAELGLQDHLLRQGVALKLIDGELQHDPAAGIHELSPQLRGLLGRFLHLPRTETLLWDVFQHQGGFPDRWTRWVDRPTQSIPFYYAYTHYAALEAHLAEGRMDQVQRHSDRMNAFAAVAQDR
jgi:hypothetical protein